MVRLVAAALVLSACASPKPGPDQDHDRQPPQAESPLADNGSTSEPALPTSDHSSDAPGPPASPGDQPPAPNSAFDCEPLITPITKAFGPDWEVTGQLDCYTWLTNAREGLEVGVRAYGLQTASDGHWSLDSVYPVTSGVRELVVDGPEGAYQALMFYDYPVEKTGAPWWGPAPMAVAAAGKNGMVVVDCTTSRYAGSKAEGDELQQVVAAACPTILAQVRFDHLGRPVPPRPVEGAEGNSRPAPDMPQRTPKLTVWAIDPEGTRSPEVLYTGTEPDTTLLGASPGGAMMARR